MTPISNILIDIITIKGGSIMENGIKKDILVLTFKVVKLSVLVFILVAFILKVIGVI